MNDRVLAYRVRILPEQLKRARDRHIMLCREAYQLGFHDLLSDTERNMVNG